MKTWWVTISVDGRWQTVVDAESVDEAIKEAELDFMDANLGESFEVVGYKPVTVEDEDDIVWEG